jgi:hypothetical protein
LRHRKGHKGIADRVGPSLRGVGKRAAWASASAARRSGESDDACESGRGPSLKAASDLSQLGGARGPGDCGRAPAPFLQIVDRVSDGICYQRCLPCSSRD